MKIIALPFTEMPVHVSDEYDPTCLLRIGGQKLRVVGRVSIARKAVHIKTEAGFECATPKAIPVVQVVAKECVWLTI